MWLFTNHVPSPTAIAAKISLKSGLSVLNNVAHTPMLNPIEEFFSKFKYLLWGSQLKENNTLSEVFKRPLQSLVQLRLMLILGTLKL